MSVHKEKSKPIYLTNWMAIKKLGIENPFDVLIDINLQKNKFKIIKKNFPTFINKQDLFT